ncbi:MAG TPA: NACHT domain-containing protein [Pyrinomonadaceae bacterium]|nr:NACHT domain-containing protein [Pyrinomonadaceae bacterium]
MSHATQIRILEKDNNRRGDLFGRLMADLFVALGYEQPRLNLHKAGRELDLVADHRLERRRAVGECKATADKTGGDDLNKFAGALDAERGSNDIPLTGYFISLAGFKETAVEQEKNRRSTKLVLLDGPRVVDELIKGRSLIPRERAAELAGRCISSQDALTLDDESELLAHERGWIWAIYYTQGKGRTHFALIHADGTPLARAVADEIIDADRGVGGSLHKLTCLNPVPPRPADDEQQVSEALKAYGRYLAEECGYIHLDGLPTDIDISSTRIRLESLFVPMHLDVEGQGGRRKVGAALADNPRLAILAAPGGGKSTLLKRLAIAYADPSRRVRVADDLPQRDWFPIFVRCRELRELARGSFADLLGDLLAQGPMRQHAATLRAYIDTALAGGRVLLLVDELDEISDPSDRLAFASTLHSLIKTYPDTALVVTSREVGFRHVAAHLAAVCTRATLSPFDAEDIERLTVAWHREVVGDNEKVRADSEQLARTIISSDRMLRLAVNPLLLTTLLLVRRWVGSLPTRRAILYGKAVEVLLMTWNTEGFRAVPEEEALPQLCYVASAMMLEGVKKVSRPRLAQLLQEARDALPTELGFAWGSVEDFIRRVEYRSGLLTATGPDIEEGRLVGFYEFSHVTFQEFLTARAVVEGWHPNRKNTDTLATVLEPHFENEEWREVIPLAAALGGKATDGLIRRLTERIAALDEDAWLPGRNSLILVLGNCLADEVAARAETIDAAVGALARFGIVLEEAPFMAALANGRYGGALRAAMARNLPKRLLEEADKEEQAARDALAQFEYEPARRHLEAAMSGDPERADRLRDEFGFLFASLTDEAAGAADRLRWCTEVWYVLSQRNSFVLPEPGPGETEAITSGEAAAGPPAGPGSAPEINRPARPEEKGDELEDAVERLFRSFFRLGKDVPWKIRKQKRGTQGGFDLSIEWSGEYETATDQKVRCHIECKNYKNNITLAEVAEKLLSEPRRNPTIDHWILISPRANPSNELNRFLESQENEETFPFSVQVWCPETGVNELFGLEPSAYDLLCDPRDDEPHPSTWDQAKREAVQAKWRERLKPFLRLPRGWNQYLRDPRSLCLDKETPEKMEETFKNFVPMGCRNSAGVLLEKSLESYIDDWLAAPDKPVLFLLGEFGDGKSFFTYVQARRLTAQWFEDRASGWLPLRLALSKYPGNARDFLRQRLEEFNAEVGGWRELGKTMRRLVMLDGFDEMSSELDPESLTRNVKALLECVNEFEGCKIIITSRTHFFQNKKDAQRLLLRLGKPPIYHLAPIPRKSALDNLYHTLPDEKTRQELLQRIQSMNDPIGLAGKPLFLEMLKEVLRAPDLPRDLDVVSLYERYIDQSLRRKPELLDDPNLQTEPREVIDNLRDILSEIAIDLQSTGRTHVNLSKFRFPGRKPFAELLWQLSDGERLNEDAKGRVAARSLLARVFQMETEDEEWPVDFCHRSMREYFVSVRLCQAVEQGEEAGAKFLQEVPLNHEILDFAAERWRKRGPAIEFIKEKLLALIRHAVPANNPGRVGGYALTLFYRLEPLLPRSFDWAGKVFDQADLEEADLSGLDFHSSSFRHANLANVNFEDSNFEHCDLTGVRLEETAHVVSIGIDTSGEHLVAAYGDNLLRQWFIGAGRKSVSKVVGNVRADSPSAVGIHKSGQLWMQVGQEWYFFDLQSDQTWKPSTRFHIKDVITRSRVRGHLMTLVERNAGGGVQVSLVDLTKQAKLGSLRAGAVHHCASLGTGAVAYSDAETEVHVRSLGRRNSQGEIRLQCPEPSCLDVLTLEAGRHLLAVGTVKGHVYVWELELRPQEWHHRKILELAAHEGIVTGVAFQNEKRLASSSFDRSIAIINFDEADAASDKLERRLMLKLRCKGMKIEGLRPETERARLAKLI